MDETKNSKRQKVFIDTTCKTCGLVFQSRWYQKTKTRQYCSKSCYYTDKEAQKVRIDQILVARNIQRTQVLIFCKTCGKEKLARQTKGQNTPQYCSYVCMHADKEALRAKTALSTAARRTPESRAKTSTANRIRYQDPQQRQQTGEISRRVQQKEWHEKPCACGCGELVRYSWSPARKSNPQQFIRGHNTKTQEFRKQQSERVKQELLDNPEHKRQKIKDLQKGLDNIFGVDYLTKPAQITAEILKELTIPFEREWVIGNFACDFYLPTIHGVIEVQGDYWHCNPRVYPHGPIDKTQQNRRRLDTAKATFLRNRGIKLLALWEYDLTRHSDQCRQIIIEFATNY